MLRKRLIGVVTVKDGRAVQSFGYRRWLPLGRPEVLVENLDRWGVDEILLQCIDRSAKAVGPDLSLLERIGRVGLATPLIYGGGIRNVADANAVVHAAADRVVVDALLHKDLGAVRAISSHLGAQAVIGALPLSLGGSALRWLDHCSGNERDSVDAAVLDLFGDGIVSEALVIDWRHEGAPCAFDDALINAFPRAGVPLIAFGGLSDVEQHRRLLALPSVVATAVGNFLAYREHAVQALKTGLGALPLRPPTYAAEQA